MVSVPSNPTVETVEIVRDDKGNLHRVVLKDSEGRETMLPVTEIQMTATSTDRQGHFLFGIHGHRVHFVEGE